MKERWQKIEQIYHAALDRPAESRASYLVQACSGDEDLLREVTSLLAQDSTGPLDRPAWDGAESLLRDQPLQPGSTLGPYEITGILGQGGMGRVYAARDNRLSRSVAIKIATGNFGEHFRQEARAVAALNHPNICTLYDVGPNYLVMELVEGDTLADRIRQGPLPVPEALALARQIAQALEAAHEHGIIHRDLKPANIKVKPDGTVKVIDFGLAKSAPALAGDPDQSPTVTMTQPGMILGTASYMAPEQASGKALDRRVDIWAFGVVLAEMLTGKRLFQGDTLAETMAAVIKDPPKLDRLPKATPTAVRQLLARCLEKDPAQRLRDIGEARIALAAPAPPTKRRIWIAVAALAAITFVVDFARVRLFPARRPEPTAEATLRPILTSPNAETQPALSPDGQTVAYISKDGTSEDLYVKPIDAETPVRLTNTPEKESWPRWSPDGKYLSFARQRGTNVQILIRPAGGGVERSLVEQPALSEGALSAAWHPDGKSLVYSAAASQTFLQSVDLATGALKPLTHPPSDVLGDSLPAYLPDGRRLAFYRFRTQVTGTVEVLEVSTGRTRSYPVDGQVAGILADGTDALILSMNTNGGQLRRLHLGDGSLRPIRGLPSNLLFPSASADGRRLVAQQQLRDVNIWRLPLPQPGVAGKPSQWIASTYEDYDPRFSPLGDQILFSSRRSGTFRPWLVDRDGRNPRLLEVSGAYFGSPRWSPDGRRITYDIRIGASAQVVVVSSLGGTPQQITFDSFENIVPSWSHDSQWIYYCSNRSGRQELWRIPAAGGKSEPVTRNGAFEAQESRDGRYLYFSRSRAKPDIVRRSADGTEETLISALSGRSWVAGETGIYFVHPVQNQILYFDFATKKSSTVLTLDKPGPNVHRRMDLSPDGRELLWAQIVSFSSDIVLIENFRE